MNVEGSGLIGSAFRARGSAREVTVYAAGVATSEKLPELAYSRDLVRLYTALRHADGPLVYFSNGLARNPVTRYGWHKLQCEKMVLHSSKDNLVLRAANIVGPHANPAQLVPYLVHRVQEGSVAVQVGAYRDLLDAEDLVTITLGLLEVDANGIIDVASGVPISAYEIVEEIALILGTEPHVSFRSGGEAQEFDTTELLFQMPELRFDPRYPVDVLERYVPLLARD